MAVKELVVPRGKLCICVAQVMAAEAASWRRPIRTFGHTQLAIYSAEARGLAPVADLDM